MAWARALQWRQELDDVVSVMLAIAVSTEQIGDQLFLQVIGDAGSGKTQFCDGMIVSKTCYPLEHLTGFHSGWKDQDGNDFSLISRINHKTLVTPEGDVLMSSPRFVEIMSQQRRIFDGTSGASFKNRKEDMRYTGLRTPWIIAGTPSLMESDQSRLGDRFLRICIEAPNEEEKQEILKRVGQAALRSVIQASDGSAKSQIDPRLREAHQLTGGYIDHLRRNASDFLSELHIDETDLIGKCGKMAEFTASMRARPSPYTTRDTIETRELPTRLTHQFVRLACCLAVVLNHESIDREVLRRVRKVALDTSKGQSLEIVRNLITVNEDGKNLGTIAAETGRTDDQTRRMLKFLKRLEVVEMFKLPAKKGKGTYQRWKLTEKMANLYSDVIGD